jgi:hypothetical protein
MKFIYFLISLLIFQVGCSSLAQERIFEQIKIERKPFQRSSFVIQQPKEFQNRELDSGKTYDPKPRVVIIDEKAGKFEFHWIGYDGKEKVVAYQRHDAIDAIVEVKLEKLKDGKRLYKYLFKVLSTSPSRLLQFVVQTISKDIETVKQENVYIGEKNKAIPIFQDGIWFSYYPMHEKGLVVNGGESIEFQLKSLSLPGIVNCKTSGGDLGTKGVGEDLPQELEDQLPVFEDLASGYTIGPVESLSTLSKPERAKYLLDNLSKFQEAGWMSEGTAKNYEAILKKEDLAGALEKAKKDLESEFITSEVFHIIEGLNQ